MKVSETDECEIKGDEWKKLSDQAKELCQKKCEAVKAQHDRDPTTFLTNAAQRRRATQPGEGNAVTGRVQLGLQGQG